MMGKIWPTREQIYAAKSILAVEHLAAATIAGRSIDDIREEVRKEFMSGGDREDYVEKIIRPQTWEAVNRAVLASAKQDKLESGATVRIDSTVTAALMHEPSDSALLWDAVRVMTRLLRQAAALPGAPALQWRDRRRLAKKRARAIEYSRGKANRRRLYCELIAAARATLAELQGSGKRVADLAGIAAERWR